MPLSNNKAYRNLRHVYVPGICMHESVLVHFLRKNVFFGDTFFKYVYTFQYISTDSYDKGFEF